MNTRTLAIRIATTIATAVAAALMAGCGGNTTSTTNPPPTVAAPTSVVSQPQAHNQADVTFAQQMIPHHAQAVAMSQHAAQQAASAQVKDLAKRIEAAQQPEIDRMTAWLRSWNAQVPSTTDSGMPGMDHGGMSSGMPGMDHGGMSPGTGPGMPGMMSDEQMQQLGQARGAVFDRMFLQMMVDHHEGAISMAQSELRNGHNADAKALAQDIITAQQREITEMRDLLNKI